jgi:hypothetical protein
VVFSLNMGIKFNFRRLYRLSKMWKASILSSTIICTTSTIPHLSETFSLHRPVYSSIRYIEPGSLLSSVSPSSTAAVVPISEDEAPPGTVKSIIPCTPLAIVKCLEHVGVYNKILKYGDRAYGKTVTVINR